MFFSPSARAFYTLALHGGAIPSDAIAITADEHQALLTGLSHGQVIVIGDDGRPALAEAPLPPAEALATQVRARRALLLAESDWTQLPDAPLDAAGREAWRAYRQSLRALPEQEGFPVTVEWPVAPGAERAADEP